MAGGQCHEYIDLCSDEEPEPPRPKKAKQQRTKSEPDPDFELAPTSKPKRTVSPAKRGGAKKAKPASSPPAPKKAAVPPQEQRRREWLLNSLLLARGAKASNGDGLVPAAAMAVLDHVLDETRMPAAAQCLLAHLLLPTNHSAWVLGCPKLQKKAGLDARAGKESAEWCAVLDALEASRLVEVLPLGSEDVPGGASGPPRLAQQVLRFGGKAAAVGSAAQGSSAAGASSSTAPGAAPPRCGLSLPGFNLRAFTLEVALPMLIVLQLKEIAPQGAGCKNSDSKAVLLAKIAGEYIYIYVYISISI